MKKILIIDDEPALVEILKTLFLAHHLQVLTAANGKNGLELALAEHPNLLILDIHMPVMSGLQMLEELRKDAWGKKVPVVMLTNLNDTESISAAMNLHTTKFLVKVDWQIDDLVKEVEDLLAVIERIKAD